MGTLHTITAPPPSLFVAGDRPPVANAYFAVTIDAAVDLLEAREYRDLPRSERLTKAQAEQLRDHVALGVRDADVLVGVADAAGPLLRG